MIACDSCNQPADPKHVRKRIERLELATRFRPVHIRVLFLDREPPLRAEEYFYRAASGPPRPFARTYFQRVINDAGAGLGPAFSAEEFLAEFQRNGFFLTCAVECPLEDSSKAAEAVRHNAASVIKRVEHSYKPKFIALLSADLSSLIPELQAAGWSDRLILDRGRPFPDVLSQAPQDVTQTLRSQEALAEAIARLF